MNRVEATGPLSLYQARLAAGDIEPDPRQHELVTAFQDLHGRLAGMGDMEPATGFFGLFSRRAAAPRGLYLHGGVGGGKTMLMDMFFATAPLAQKRRVHFHAFMREVHELIRGWRQAVEADPIPLAASDIARSTRLLCLDEFQVNDIADAMILGRLFTALFREGVVLVATSNTAPDNLYADGLNRALFLPFIDLLHQKADIFALEGERDYRLGRLRGVDLYFTPLDDRAEQGMRAVWDRLTNGRKGEPASLGIGGRTLAIPAASHGAVRFSFAQLCEQPLASADYLALARFCHALFLHGIPVMPPEKRNEARRFMILVDTLYDEGVKLIASAAAEPDRLYTAGSGAAAFRRTASRLMEMRSQDYLRL